MAPLPLGFANSHSWRLARSRVPGILIHILPPCLAVMQNRWMHTQVACVPCNAYSCVRCRRSRLAYPFGSPRSTRSHAPCLALPGPPPFSRSNYIIIIYLHDVATRRVRTPSVYFSPAVHILPPPESFSYRNFAKPPLSPVRISRHPAFLSRSVSAARRILSLFRNTRFSLRRRARTSTALSYALFAYFSVLKFFSGILFTYIFPLFSLIFGAICSPFPPLVPLLIFCFPSPSPSLSPSFFRSLDRPILDIYDAIGGDFFSFLHLGGASERSSLFYAPSCIRRRRILSPVIIRAACVLPRRWHEKPGAESEIYAIFFCASFPENTTTTTTTSVTGRREFSQKSSRNIERASRESRYFLAGSRRERKIGFFPLVSEKIADSDVAILWLCSSVNHLQKKRSSPSTTTMRR